MRKLKFGTVVKLFIGGFVALVPVSLFYDKILTSSILTFYACILLGHEIISWAIKNDKETD